MTELLVEVKELHKHFVVAKDFFGRPKSILKAVNGVSFAIERGETLGLVGESGCGKSTTGRTLIGLYAPTKGQVIFDGKEISAEHGIMHKDIQMIFQDPYASLNPRMTVADIIGEPLDIHPFAKTAMRGLHASMNCWNSSGRHANRQTAIRMNSAAVSVSASA